MIALHAHFDGKVLIPDEPLDLKPNQRVRIEIETIDIVVAKPRTDWRSLIGIGLPLPVDHTPRFNSNDDLWDKDK